MRRLDKRQDGETGRFDIVATSKDARVMACSFCLIAVIQFAFRFVVAALSYIGNCSIRAIVHKFFGVFVNLNH